MKTPGSENDELDMPAADELWPDRPPSATNADDSDTPDDQLATIASDEELWRFASPRPSASPVTPPKPFPVAPPIPPLSFAETAAVTGIGDTQPEPAVVETARPDKFHMEDTLPTASPRPPVPREEPIMPSPATTSDRARGAYRNAAVGPDGLEAILRAAAARGVSTLYLRADTELSGRIQGELHILEGTPVLGSDEIEMLLVFLKLAHQKDARRSLASTEWGFDLADVGHVQCTTFKDHRGAGAMFQIVPDRLPAAEQIGLSLNVQLLAVEQEGLVVVAGPRSSGKLRLMHQLAALITRSRRAYVIAVQRGAGRPTAHDAGAISQREVRDGLDDMLAVARAALRENPDVLLLQETRSAPLMSLALDAAASGQLVIAGFTAPTAVDALERIVALYPAEQARSVQLRLAQHLRGLIGQVLVPKVRGGRIVAQEVLLMTQAVAAVLSDGHAWQLRAALEASATHGMVPLIDVLVDLVRTGEVRPEDAYRHAPDRPALLERFKSHGIDTSFTRA
jgi:twitching motility protein PilT